MNKRILLLSLFLLFLSGTLLGTCAGRKNNSRSSAKPSEPLRDNTPKVLVPEASGTASNGNDIVTFDASHTDQGYIMVQYRGANQKVKLQISGPDGVTYTYLLSKGGNYETFPFTAGNGTYALRLLENVNGDTYSIAFTLDLDVTITNEFTPFLYPNQYVNFTADSKTVAKGKKLAKKARSDLDVVKNIYHYVIKNITYDDDKAENAAYGYLPNVDETLDSRKGICFDYAAVMTAMLRSQAIPARLEVGYAGEAYHSWISTYVDDIGWVDDIIKFDGKSWKLMDPTFAANSDSRSLKEYIGDGSNYVLKYSY